MTGKQRDILNKSILLLAFATLVLIIIYAII